MGLALARRFDYGRDFWQGLEKLVYYVLFPALLFRSLATAKVDFAQAGGLVGSAWAFTAAGFALSLAARPLFGLDRPLHATGSQCGYRFNTYIGLAVAGSLYGARGVALAALVLGVMIPLANFFAVAVLARESERGFVRELAQHPLVLSTLAGFAWNLAGLPLPSFADHTLALLGQTALPAGSWGLARMLELGEVEARVLILCAALPTATNAYILAVRMTGDGRAVATQVTVGTVISMATIPAWMAIPL